MYRFLLMILMGSCSSGSSSEVVTEFYNRARQHESELSILFNVSFTARGVKNEKPFIPRLEISLSENETITLPGIDKNMTDEEIKNMPFYENIEKYSKKVGISDSTAYQEVKNYCIRIIELAHRLEVYKVQSTPRLGKFIIFTLTADKQVIYVPDVSEVRNDYWIDFFKSGKKLENNWYLRNT